jgi:hypothetical protein
MPMYLERLVARRSDCYTKQENHYVHRTILAYTSTAQGKMVTIAEARVPRVMADNFVT